MIGVVSKVPIREEDGHELIDPGLDGPVMHVRSHWNHDSMVIIEVGKEKVSVSARELQAAIANATNTVRHG